MRFEKSRLSDAQRKDLADRVRHVSLKDDSLGYDIESFDDKGDKLFIEVKTTTLSHPSDFYISPKELEFAEEHLKSFRLYRVFDWNDTKQIKTLSAKEVLSLQRKATQYRCSF